MLIRLEYSILIEIELELKIERGIFMNNKDEYLSKVYQVSKDKLGDKDIRRYLLNLTNKVLILQSYLTKLELSNKVKQMVEIDVLNKEILIDLELYDLSRDLNLLQFLTLEDYVNTKNTSSIQDFNYKLVIRELHGKTIIRGNNLRQPKLRKAEDKLKTAFNEVSKVLELTEEFKNSFGNLKIGFRTTSLDNDKYETISRLGDFKTKPKEVQIIEHFINSYGFKRLGIEELSKEEGIE